MDDDGSLGIRNWGFYETVKGNLGLQLMSPVVTPDRDTKSLLPNSTFLQHHHGHQNAQSQHHHHQHQQHSHQPRDFGGGVGATGAMPTESHSVHMDFARNEAWLHPVQHQRGHEQKVILHAHRPFGQAGHVGHPGHGAHHGHVVRHHPTGYQMMPDARHTLQMMQPEAQPPPQPHLQAQEPPQVKEDVTSPRLVEDQSMVRTEPPMKNRQQNRQPKSP